MARGFLSLGGGVSIRGAAVVLNNSVVTANITAVESGERDAGGGIAVIGSFDAATGTAALASLTLNNTTVSNNTGSNGGGIVCVLCALTASNATITGNTANAGDGGGIALTGNSSARVVDWQRDDAQRRFRRIGTRGRAVGAGWHGHVDHSTARGSPPTRASTGTALFTNQADDRRDEQLVGMQLRSRRRRSGVRRRRPTALPAR